jgi:hypothetical protein
MQLTRVGILEPHTPGDTFLDKTTLLHGLKRYVYTSLEIWTLHHSSPELGLVSSLLCKVGGLPIPGHMGFQVSGSGVNKEVTGT